MPYDDHIFALSVLKALAKEADLEPKNLGIKKLYCDEAYPNGFQIEGLACTHWLEFDSRDSTQRFVQALTPVKHKMALGCFDEDICGTKLAISIDKLAELHDLLLLNRLLHDKLPDLPQASIIQYTPGSDDCNASIFLTPHRQNLQAGAALNAFFRNDIFDIESKTESEDLVNYGSDRFINKQVLHTALGVTKNDMLSEQAQSLKTDWRDEIERQRVAPQTAIQAPFK